MSSKERGQYCLHSVLGAGAQGTVYRATHIPTNRLCAIKEMDLRTMDATEREMAMQEVKVFASLAHHPHILQYEDSFLVEGCLYIVMEIAIRGTVSDLIRREGSAIPSVTVWRYFLQVTTALDYMHANKMLHRDLKAANVFLCGDTAKVGDFGVSRILTSATSCVKSVIGTPFYLSPEMCHGRAYGAKSDVWALGCFLYELLMRKTAFHADNQAALVLNIIRGRSRGLDPDCDPQLAAMCKQCLKMNESERPTASQILSHPFAMPHMLSLSLTVPGLPPPAPPRITAMPVIPPKMATKGRVPTTRTRKIGMRPPSSQQVTRQPPPPPRRVPRARAGDVQAVRQLPDYREADHSSGDDLDEEKESAVKYSRSPTKARPGGYNPPRDFEEVMTSPRDDDGGVRIMPGIGVDVPEEEDDGRTVFVTWRVDGESGVVFGGTEEENVVVPWPSEEEKGGTWRVDGESGSVVFGGAEDREEEDVTDLAAFARQLRAEAECVVAPETFSDICAMLREVDGPLRGDDIQAFVTGRVGEAHAALVMQLAFRVVFAEGQGGGE